MSPLLLGMLLGIAALIALGLKRAYEGPTVFDRLIAVSLLSVNGVVVLVLLGFVFDRPAIFLDIALGYALLAFLLPIALGRFIDVSREQADTTPRDDVEADG